MNPLAGTGKAKFWVYENFREPHAFIHHPSCLDCKDGKGKHGKGCTKNGKWTPYLSYEAAKNHLTGPRCKHFRDCCKCKKKDFL